MNLVGALLEAMHRHADRIAVEDGGEVLRYGELEQQTRCVAAALGDRGVGPERAVVLDLPLGASWLVAWLGVWRAGGVVVPLDPEDPPARREGIAAVVAPVMRLRAPDVRAMANHGGGGDGPSSLPRDEDLAYVVFSSGSTGRPKGVAVEHRGLLGVLADQVERFGVCPEDRCLAMLSPAFDASISDFAVALLAGATWVVAPRGLHREPGSLLEMLTSSAITFVDLPPALLPRLLSPSLPQCLRTIVVGGEVADPEAVRALAASRRVINVYGPTEASICVTTVACSPQWTVPDLGRPIGGARLRVVDDELWIGGPVVARGYLDEPELMRTRFVADEAGRWFRTGDRVRLEADGCLVFLGRLDRQFKRRGRLFDPHEIEAVTRAQPGVGDVALVDVALPDGGRTPVAFIVPATTLDHEALRAHWSARLPAWMVPARVVELACLPRTSRGKIDYDALRSHASPAAATGQRDDDALCNPASPAAATGERDDDEPLRAAWSAVLGVPEPQLEDDFFAAGGDSVAVLTWVARLHAQGILLDPAEVYRARTLGALLELAPERRRHSVAVPEVERRARAILAAVADEPWASDDGHDDVSLPEDAILLTGATGALGSRWLAAWSSSRRPVIAVVRASDLAHARRRLTAALQTWGELSSAPGADRDVGGLPRVTVVVGDLTRPRLGWRRRTWDRVAAAATTIVHAGAAVHLAAPLAMLEPANVEGTARIVALTRDAGARVLPISTLSVLLETDAPAAADDEREDRGPAAWVHGGYAASKWAAEVVVEHLEARWRGPMLRLGLLTGESATGRMVGDDQLSRTIRGVAKIGGVPPLDPELAFDMTPIDDVVEVIDRCIDGPEPQASVVHVAHRYRGTAAALRDAIARETPIRSLGAAAFLERAAAIRDADVAVARLALSPGGPGDLFLMTGRRPRPSPAFAGFDLRPPLSTAEDLLQRYVRHALAKEAR